MAGREQDGTLEWDSTTLDLVRLRSGEHTGLGYTYGDVSVAMFIRSKLAPLLSGADVAAPPVLWRRASAALRNAGRPGVGAMALSAVDVAVWDLKARLLDLPLFRLLPSFHEEVPVYGSGGFTNYPLDRLREQAAGWVERGIPRVKVKTGRDPEADPGRLSAVREAIGDAPELLTDANGALPAKEAAGPTFRPAGREDTPTSAATDRPSGPSTRRSRRGTGLSAAAVRTRPPAPGPRRAGRRGHGP